MHTKAKKELISKKNLESTRYVAWLTWSIIFATPFRIFHDPFNAAKIVAALFILSIIVFKLKEDEILPNRKKRFILLFYLLPISEFIVATNDRFTWFNNFHGDYHRYNGIFLGLLTAYIVALISKLRLLRLEYVFRNFVRVALVIVTFQVANAVGINPLDIKIENTPSLIGNSNFASSITAGFMLSLLNFKAVYKRNSKFWAIGLSCIFLISLKKFGDFQGFFVIAVGVFTFLLLWLSSRYQINKYFVIFVFSSIWTLGILLLHSVINISLIERFLNLSGNYVRRLEYWEYAISMFRENPFFGVGINGFLDATQNLKSIDVIRRDGSTIWVDSAHSVPLHYFATGGYILGFSYLIFVIITAIVAILICTKKVKNLNERLTLAAIWFGFQSQSLVSISVPAIMITNSIFTGLVWRVFFSDHQSSGQFYSEKTVVNWNTSIKEKILYFKKFFIVISFVATAIYISLCQFILSQSVQSEQFTLITPRSFSELYPSDRALEFLANGALENGKIDDAIIFLDKTIAINGSNGRPYYSKGYALQLQNRTKIAEKYYRKALELDSKNTFYLENLIRIKIINEDFYGANLLMRKLEVLDPNYLKLDEIHGLMVSTT